MRAHAPAVLRNRQPIAAVLAQELPEAGTALEVASGTGDHRLRDLAWLDEVAGVHGLIRTRRVAMSANNLMLVYRRA